jgi:hypothetical protein
VQRHAVGNDDDLMTREYRRGDALRRVHWKATARHGELMVRQEEQRTFPEARLLIDTRSESYGRDWAGFGDQGFERAGLDRAAMDSAAIGGVATDGAGIGGAAIDNAPIGGAAIDSAAFEWAVSMIASIGIHLHGGGFRVRVIETAPAQIAALGDANQGAGHDREFLISLSSVRLTTNSPEVDLDADRGLGSDPDNPTKKHPDRQPGPIFAVVARPTSETLRWIAAQRSPFETGIAFVIGAQSTRTVTELAAAGWTCVTVDEDDDPRLAWQQVLR